MPYYTQDAGKTINTANVAVKCGGCTEITVWPRVGHPEDGVGTFNGSEDTRWDPCQWECFPSGVV